MAKIGRFALLRALRKSIEDYESVFVGPPGPEYAKARQVYEQWVALAADLEAGGQVEVIESS